MHQATKPKKNELYYYNMSGQSMQKWQNVFQKDKNKEIVAILKKDRGRGIVVSIFDRLSVQR